MSDGCYRCGSSQGSTVRPCPSCAGKRFDPRENPKEDQRSSRSITVENKTFRFPSSIVGGAGAALLITIAVWLNWTEIKVMTGTASATDIYNACLSGGGKALSQTKDDIGKAIVSGIMVEMCTEIRNSCASDPQGEKCEKARQMIKMMSRR